MMAEKIGMHNLGGALYIDVDVWDKSAQIFRRGFLMFDTGATVTTISSDILAGLGYNTTDGPVQQITTGSGIAFVKEVEVDKIRLGTYEIENVKVYSHTFPDESFSTGVIGLNVISLFDINLLFSKRLIEFNKFGGAT